MSSGMTHGTSKPGESEPSGAPPRPPSSHGSTNSSGSSKHVRCIGRYVITGSLGKGNFARVEAAVHTLTRAKVAIKIIETDKIKEDYVRKNLLREAQLMRRLRHPNIIRLYETMKTSNLYCLVTEIAEGGELLSHVRSDFKEKRLSEATTRPFIRQLVSALYHLHSVGIVHRDLKMENILLDKRKRQVKIVDFGLSNAAKPGSLLQTHCGSPEYAAPELFIPGREYGPEVDVWSLGVNMYAMMMGKLPFRSPRQGTKRRQKLLEQISGGLTDSHEREMEHISKGAKDLIYRLLQPDPQRRTGLGEVMEHPWVTKDGTQPLHPFKYTPPDAATQMTVIELMSTVLEVNPTDIKETVRRDRCDWLAAIYNLLLDQPEGRNIIQRLIMDDPEEQLVDAAHYQGSMEHLRLSQGDNLDSYPPDVATMLYNATAHMKRKSGHRYSLSQPHPQAKSESGEYTTSTLPLTRREKQRHTSQEPHPLSGGGGGGGSGGGPRHLGPVSHAPYTLRRASISSPMTSPDHQPFLLPHQQLQHLSHSMHGHTSQPHPHGGGEHYPMQQQHPQYGHHGNRHRHSHHSGGGHKSGGKRMLPMTPSEEPYQQPYPDTLRSHSRAESAPDHPLPTPWRPNLAPRNQLAPHSPLATTPTSPISPANPFSSNEELDKSHGHPPPPLKEPLISPTPLPMPTATIKSASKKKLNPLRPKSVNFGGGMQRGGTLSKSTDGLNVKVLEQPGSHTLSGVSWGQPPPKSLKKKRHSEGFIGWTSTQRLGQPADIQSLMQSGQGLPSTSLNAIPHHHKLDTSTGASVSAAFPGNQAGSLTSVDLNHELFAPQQPLSNSASPMGSKGSSPLGPSPQASNAHFRPASERGGEGYNKIEPLPAPLRDIQSSSQKQRWHQHPLPSPHAHLRTASAKPTKRQDPHYMAQLPQEYSTSMEYVGTEGQRGHAYQKELPQLEEKATNRRSSIPGFIGKAFKSKNSLKEKSASMTLHPKPV